MTFTTHSVSPTAGVRDVVLVKLTHTTWADVLRYADDVVDWVVADGTYTATGADADGEPTDETGVDSRGIVLPDPDLTLWRRLEELARNGDSDPVTVTVYRYLSSNLAAPAVEPAIFRMSSPSRAGRMVSFDASTVDTVNRDAPPRKFTFANSPGLRR